MEICSRHFPVSCHRMTRGMKRLLERGDEVEISEQCESRDGNLVINQSTDKQAHACWGFKRIKPRRSR